MFTSIKRLLIGISEDNANSASALAYGLSLASLAQTRVTLRAVSTLLTTAHAETCAAIGGDVANEDRQRNERIARACTRAKLDAALAGVICDASMPPVDYLNQVPE